MFNKIILLFLCFGLSLASLPSFVVAEDTYPTPVKVTIVIDIDNEDSMRNLYDVLDKIEFLNWHANVYVTGELASNHRDFVSSIEERGHKLGVLGWNGEEDLSSLNYTEQVNVIKNSILAVKNAVNKPENIEDFKAPNYKFNYNTFKVLQELGVKSIVGAFGCDESLCKCWYAQSLGKITFPYPLTTEFWLIPVSTISTELGDVLLDDSIIFNVTNNTSDYLNYLLEGYRKANETKDPLVIVVHPSIIGLNSERLNAFTQFLQYIKNNKGKVVTIDQIRHHTRYITNLRVSGPDFVYTGEEITLTVSYTSNIYCPQYRFHVYGRYPGEDWRLLDNWEHCYFVYTGDHSFDVQVTIPRPPQDENTYTIRVVGQASFGTCEISDPDWPTYDNYQAMDEITLQIIEPNIRFLFVPLRWTNSQDDFELEVNAQLDVFLNQIPLRECRERVRVDVLNVDTQNFEDFPCSERNCGVNSIRPFVRSLGIDDSIYDVVVGIIEDQQIPTPCQEERIMGCANGIDTLWISTGYDHVLAHEMGHIYGLSDEYCSTLAGAEDCRCNNGRNWCINIMSCPPFIQIDPPEPNPLDPNLGCDPQGDCCTVCSGGYCNQGYVVCCEGNRNPDGGRCIMSYADAQEPRTFCEYCREHLANQPDLNCDSNTRYEESSERTVVLEFLIYNNGTTIPQNIDITTGKPTSESILNNLIGDYEIKILDGENKVVVNQTFQPSFGYNGPVLRDVDYSNISFDFYYLRMSVPLIQSMRTLELYRNETMLFSETLPITVFKGHVLDDNLNPIQDVFVELVGENIYSTFTDANGSYDFIGIEAGSYRVIVTPPPYANLKSAQESVIISAGDTVILNFHSTQQGVLQAQ